MSQTIPAYRIPLYRGLTAALYTVLAFGLSAACVTLLATGDLPTGAALLLLAGAAANTSMPIAWTPVRSRVFGQPNGDPDHDQGLTGARYGLVIAVACLLAGITTAVLI